VKKKLIVVTPLILSLLLLSIQSCKPDVLQPNVKYDNTISTIGNIKDCVGNSLTITKGNIRVIQELIIPNNNPETAFYKITFQSNDFHLKDVNQKEYVSNETLSFQINQALNPSLVFSVLAKLHFINESGNIILLNFNMRQGPGTGLIVDNPTFNPSNLGCLITNNKGN